MYDSLIINFISCIFFNVYNQVIIHLLNAKQIMEQNLILLVKKKKKLRVFPNFFLKGKQIKFFKLFYIYIYIYLYKFKSGWSWDHLGLKVAPPLLKLIQNFSPWERTIGPKLLNAIYCLFIGNTFPKININLLLFNYWIIFLSFSRKI